MRFVDIATPCIECSAGSWSFGGQPNRGADERRERREMTYLADVDDPREALGHHKGGDETIHKEIKLLVDREVKRGED
jgi:hypothetical protein